MVKEIAHVKKNDQDEWVVHALDEHLRSVAQLAGEKAKFFNGSDWAYLAGLWHDLGKYRPVFQNYIKGISGYNPEAHIEQGRVDHSTAGAIHAINEFGLSGRILAYLISGHHAGLPDWNASDGQGNAALEHRISNGEREGYLAEALDKEIPADILIKDRPSARPPGDKDGLHLWIRMLFSCLVDADFLDTEVFMSPEKTHHRGNFPDLFELKNCFDRYMEDKISKATNTLVNKTRLEVLRDSRDAAFKTPGIFTLTVPTGGGKTLASMAFALDHALKFDKRRIIVAIPYTSIIEQTADQYRKIFKNGVIEHHSNLDPDKETSKSRLSSENWDAPIIVTTNVQLLESLFAARTNQCRKLHNIVNSVIIIDEAQLLPPQYLQPVLDILRLLTNHYGVTLVLSTATQPALKTVKNGFGHKILHGLDGTQEIIKNVPELYKKLNRVKIEIPTDLRKPVSWDELAQRLCEHDSVLVIVNTRKDCRALFDLMPNGTIHLSGLMCGEHRSHVIQEIKRSLQEGIAVRVVSTQLVEAGVDLDFPVVYRALSGLDSVAQAAGRCNREGRLEQGRVVIFISPSQTPKGMLSYAEQATLSVWHNWEGEPLDHRLFEHYFKHYYSSVNADQKNIISLLTKDALECDIQFRTAAKSFRIIEDAGVQILIPYNDKVTKLLNSLRAIGPDRWLMRSLQRFSVTLYEQDFTKLRNIGVIEEIYPGIYALSSSDMYDQRTGLLSVVDIMSANNVF